MIVSALTALLVSIAFTLLATAYPHVANIVAAPITLCIVVLLVKQKREDNRRA